MKPTAIDWNEDFFIEGDLSLAHAPAMLGAGAERIPFEVNKVRIYRQVKRPGKPLALVPVDEDAFRKVFGDDALADIDAALIERAEDSRS